MIEDDCHVDAASVRCLLTLRTYEGSTTDIPLCDQATVEKEANKGAKLWNEGAPYGELDIGPVVSLDELLPYA